MSRRRALAFPPRFPVGLFLLFAAGGSIPVSLFAGSDAGGPRPEIEIPRVQRPPKLEDFLDMKPNREMDGQLAKVEGFKQFSPKDGEPASQPTEVYLGYDDENLYLVWVCFDSEPHKVRARKTRRENILEEDTVVVTLDTFNDQLRSFEFWANPFGIQLDAQWTESQGLDISFDTVWQSRGRLTDRGYVVWMAIPFKSLRFPSKPIQEWGIIFWRVIPRANEESTWPDISSRIQGELNQAGILRGMENISPGRNMQVVPFGFFRSFRALDERDPLQPRFQTDNAAADGGVDAKFVLKDSFTVDVAVNPDFSQVESDDPQVTVNRRFEVFFPEKRPFFIENASFFETPINLFFTRRIADPQFGVRVTGKRGPYAIGALLADDEAPGKNVPDLDPVRGKRARFGILRVNRDIFKQSTVGLIYTDREFFGTSSRAGGVDGRFKLNKNWVATFQGVASSTEFLDGTRIAGPAYDAQIRREGRQFFYNLQYNDRSPGFRTRTGFLTDQTVERFVSDVTGESGGREISRPSLRPDIRSLSQFATFRFRPEGKYLISWGPTILINPVWDHQGTRLDMFYDTSISWELTGQTLIEVFQSADRELLRPQDFPVLLGNQDFYRNRKGLFFETSYLPQLTFRGEYSFGTRINFVPSEGQAPFLANLTRGNVGVTLKPLTPLRIDNVYLLERFTDRAGGANVFNNHIIRSKWNWQFKRELSLRVIFQYDSVIANPALTQLENSKNFNADFLVTYRVNPWTALFIGYNGNVQNIDLLPTATGSQIVRTQGFRHDARQFFIKFSYLFRL